MDKPVEILKRKAARYARDSFEEHKEQIFGAHACQIQIGNIPLISLIFVVIHPGHNFFIHTIPVQFLIGFLAKQMCQQFLQRRTAYAEEPVRNRFLENMSLRQREPVVDEWMHNRGHQYHLNDAFEAMDAILIAAQYITSITGKTTYI